MIEVLATRMPIDGAPAGGTDGRSCETRSPAAGEVWYIVMGLAQALGPRRPGRQRPAGNNGMAADSKRKIR